jgi:hypothetical protein
LYNPTIHSKIFQIIENLLWKIGEIFCQVIDIPQKRCYNKTKNKEKRLSRVKRFLKQLVKKGRSKLC